MEIGLFLVALSIYIAVGAQFIHALKDEDANWAFVWVTGMIVAAFLVVRTFELAFL